uniref:Peroxisomal membrane protein PEX14 n=1 Tax=Leptobrachium leishanense TaxID=445787 RepID=A0A8C5PN32_9ANUR
MADNSCFIALSHGSVLPTSEAISAFEEIRYVERCKRPRSSGSQPKRRNLVATAVKFLQNPRVRQSPVSTRKDFLKRKGLTDEEVELALQQSGTAHDDPPPMEPAVGVPRPGLPPQLAVQPYNPPRSRWRDYGALAVILAGIAFGFHQLYKRYLLPLIVGGKESRKQLQRIESAVSEMSGSVTQTARVLFSVFYFLADVIFNVQQNCNTCYSIAAALSLLRSRPAAFTGMLCLLCVTFCNDHGRLIVTCRYDFLVRRQFPPSPSTPKIPAWQISVKPSNLSNSATMNHHNSSSDISPVSNESESCSPVKEIHSPDGAKMNSHHLGPNGEEHPDIDLQTRVRMEVQGEEEEDDEDVGQADEDDHISVQTEDRRGGDGQINEPVEKLRRPEGASNEMN